MEGVGLGVEIADLHALRFPQVYPGDGRSAVADLLKPREQRLDNGSEARVVVSGFFDRVLNPTDSPLAWVQSLRDVGVQLHERGISAQFGSNGIVQPVEPGIHYLICLLVQSLACPLELPDSPCDQVTGDQFQTQCRLA